MTEFINTDIASALVSAFLHSLWTGALFYLVIEVLNRWASSRSANFFYGLNISALFLVFIITVGLFLNGIIEMPINEDLVATGGDVLVNEKLSIPSIISSPKSNQEYSTYVALLWLLGSTFFLARFIWQWIGIRKYKSEGVYNPSGDIQLIFDRLMKLGGLKRSVKLLESALVSTPMVIGYLKPVILLPLGLASNMSMEQLEAVLLHELAHINRRDYLVNILQSIIESILYFNPFVWLISRSIRAERERACDDVALSHGIKERSYVNALVSIYERQLESIAPALGFAENNKSTLKRIQRIMTTQNDNNRSVLAALLAPVLLLIVLLTPGKNLVDNAPVMASILGPIELAENSVPAIDFNALKSDSEILSLETEPTKIRQQISLSNTLTADTIDTKAFKKRQKELEAATKRLESTAEWREMQALTKEMTKMSREMMKELEPLISEEMKLSIQMSKMEIEEMQHAIREAQRAMEPVELEAMQRQVEELMAVHEKEIMAQVEAIQEKLEGIEWEQIRAQEQMAREIAEKIKLSEEELENISREAELIAKEAEAYAEAVEEFYEKTVDMLIEDGYIKSEDDIKDLDIENGSVVINGEEVKSKDRKKYLDLLKKYFKDEEFHINNN